MALTAEQQRILEHALAALPSWFTSDERQQEFLAAAAVLMGNAKVQLDYWFSQAKILEAVNATGFDPDWLNQHARDRNTTRQAGETDVALRERLRNTPDALTRPTLLAATVLILDAEGISYAAPYPAMAELPRDQAFFLDTAADTGTGGTFSAPDASDVQVFTPDVAFAGIPYRAVEEARTHKLVISGAAVGGNDGTHVITGIDGSGVSFVNAGGAASTDATCTWTVNKYDRDDNLLDGFKDSYMSNHLLAGGASPADRMASAVPGKLVIILPFGCTPGTLSSVQEMLRQKKGAGAVGLVECREVA